MRELELVALERLLEGHHPLLVLRGALGARVGVSIGSASLSSTIQASSSVVAGRARLAALEVALKLVRARWPSETSFSAR